MKLLGKTGLVKMDEDEFRQIKHALLAVGYKLADGAWGGSKELWTPDRRLCVSDREMSRGGGGAVLARYVELSALKDCTELSCVASFLSGEQQ